MRLIGLCVTLAVAAALVGCGGGSSSSPTAAPTPVPSKAVVGVLIDPNPVIAVATGNPTYPWDFRVNLQLSDSGGVGFIVTSMETTVTSAYSGQVLTTTDQNPFVGVKISAFGQETRQYHMGPYRMEFYTKEANVTIRLNFVDDMGNASVYDGTVRVMHDGDHVHLD